VVCPSHRPDLNAYVERYHRTYGQECLQVHQPRTLQEVCEVTEAFLSHYNNERPHQGRACGNVPPRVAFPSLPTLPALPGRVDPDSWLAPLDQKMYLRHVGRDGCVDVDLATYYIGPETGRMDRPLPGGSAEPPVCRLAPGPNRQAACHQRLARPADGLGRLSAVRPARGVGGSATFSHSVVQEGPTAVSLGRRSLILFCSRQLSQTLALHWSK
jgi:hypothetical protein